MFQTQDLNELSEINKRFEVNFLRSQLTHFL